MTTSFATPDVQDSFVMSLSQSIVAPLVYECHHKYFHSHCVQNQMAFRNKLYAFNGLLVCRDDYQRMRSNCPVCGQPIVFELI